MREHIISWLVTDNRQQQTENAKVEASLNLRFAESGTKNEIIEKLIKNFLATPGGPWVPHIWAPRPTFQKPLNKASSYPPWVAHIKFQPSRPSSFFHRGSPYKKVAAHFIKRRNLYMLPCFYDSGQVRDGVSF